MTHETLPSVEQRFLRSHGLETKRDPGKRRYYLYYRGRLIPSLSFSQLEWASSYPAMCVAKWKGMLTNKHFEKEVDLDYEDKQTEEKMADELDRRFGFIANEWVKFGVKGSQIPGTPSIVVDGFKK